MFCAKCLSLMKKMTFELISTVPVVKICFVVVTSQILLPFKDILKIYNLVATVKPDMVSQNTYL